MVLDNSLERRSLEVVLMVKLFDALWLHVEGSGGVAKMLATVACYLSVVSI